MYLLKKRRRRRRRRRRMRKVLNEEEEEEDINAIYRPANQTDTMFSHPICPNVSWNVVCLLTNKQ